MKSRAILEYAQDCRRCGAEGPWALDPAEARRLAEGLGWKMNAEGWLCPVCKALETKDGYGI